MRVARTVVLAALLAGLSGCTGPAETLPAPTTLPTPVGPTLSAADCPVTIPVAVPTSEPWKLQLAGSDHAYGNGKLWVGGLPAGGVLDPVPDDRGDDGSIGTKLGWWRAVAGMLQIGVRRLDAPAPVGSGHVPEGYGDQGFQSSGVTFSAPGCWEVTGSLRGGPETTNLTFVMFVIDDGVPSSATG